MSRVKPSIKSISKPKAQIFKSRDGQNQGEQAKNSGLSADSKLISDTKLQFQILRDKAAINRGDDASAQVVRAEKNQSRSFASKEVASDNSNNQKAWDVASTTNSKTQTKANNNLNSFVSSKVGNPDFREIHRLDSQVQNFNSRPIDKQGKFVDNTIEDADGNAINKNLKFKFHGYDDKAKSESGLDKKEWQQYSGDAGRLAKDSTQALSHIKNSQQKIDNSNLGKADKELLKRDGESLAFIQANRLNSHGIEKTAKMLKEDKAYIDHAKEKFSNVKGKVSEIAHKENTRALKELAGDKFQDTLATLQKYGGVKDLSNFNRRSYDRSAKDMNYMAQKNAEGKTKFQEDIAKLGQRGTFDIDIRIGGKKEVDHNGTGSNILNGIEFAQKSELKDSIGLVGGNGRNQLTLAFQDVDKAKEFVSMLREQFKEAGGKADVGNINLSFQGHGAEGQSGGFITDQGKGPVDMKELGTELGKLAAENSADSVDINGNCCGSEKQAKDLNSSIKESYEKTSKETGNEDILRIRSLSNDGRSSNSEENLADRQGLTSYKYNSDGSTSLEEQWSNGHKGQINAEKYSTNQSVDYANGTEDAFKETERKQIEVLSKEDTSSRADDANSATTADDSKPEVLLMPDSNVQDGAENDNNKDGKGDGDGAL